MCFLANHHPSCFNTSPGTVCAAVVIWKSFSAGKVPCPSDCHHAFNSTALQLFQVLAVCLGLSDMQHPLCLLNIIVHLQVQALQQAVMKIGEHLAGSQNAAGQGEPKPEGEGEKKDEQK